MEREAVDKSFFFYDIFIESENDVDKFQYFVLLYVCAGNFSCLMECILLRLKWYGK